MNEFEKIAADAEDGLPAELGRIQRFLDEGRVRHWLIVYSYTGEDSFESMRYAHSEGVPALGLAEYARHQILDNITSVDD